MKIAIFTETFLPKVDGIVTRLRNTISQLRKAGDEVLIFAPEGGLTQYEGARIVGLPAAPFPLYPELRLALPRSSMRRALQAFQPDLIHSVDPVLLGIAGIYYSDKLQVPSVVSYHTQLPKYLHYYNLSAIEPLAWKGLRVRHGNATLNLCTSTAMVDELTAHGIPRVALWQRGIDTETFHPSRASSAMRHRLTDGHPQAPLLLYVGRLSAEKSLEQIKPMLHAVPGARLALVGGGPHLQALQKYFAGMPVTFPGYMQGGELASAFASADVFVLPSRTETLGLVLLEAMAAGCPVVAVRAGGIPDLIEDGLTGLLYDTPPQAVAAIQSFLHDGAQRDRIVRDARSEAEKWDWAAATEQLRGYYRQALATGRVHSSRNEKTSPLKEFAKISVMKVIKGALP